MILPSWRREGEGRGRMELETGHPGGRCLAQTPKFKTSQSRFLRSASLEGRPAQPASARPSATLHNPNEPTPSDGGRVGAGWGQGGASSTCCIRCLMRRGPGQGRAGQGRAGHGTARQQGSGERIWGAIICCLAPARAALLSLAVWTGPRGVLQYAVAGVPLILRLWHGFWPRVVP